MNKRLVWNFECNPAHPLKLPKSDDALPQDEMRWESRFFWQDNEPIALHGLPDYFFELSRYRIKHRDDTYHLIPNTNYNLKMRRDQLFYKPLLMTTEKAAAYGKKINLANYPLGTPLPGCQEKNVETLLQLVHNECKTIHVEKEALIYTLDSLSKSKIELAWLLVGHQSYFSVSIESYSQHWVESLATQIVRDANPNDYITFLKTL